MDMDMQDIFDVKDKVAKRTLKEVAFEHLWLLYKPGDVVYTRKSPDEIGTYQAHRVLTPLSIWIVETTSSIQLRYSGTKILLAPPSPTTL